VTDARRRERGILTINGGSSTIRFALFGTGAPPRRRLAGKVDRIGAAGTHLSFVGEEESRPRRVDMAAADHASAADLLIEWLDAEGILEQVGAVGHRVVHGMDRTRPVVVTGELLDDLRRLAPYDPDHLPREIALIEAFGARREDRPQVACFDTAFHHTMPRVARLLPLPRRFERRGARRYGFHGLSYRYLVEELDRLEATPRAKERVVLAHLGNGASLAAVSRGRSIDTSMGFTPASGLPMSTRTGDLDPGLIPYLERTENISPDALYRMINRESGLLGVSETSSDMRDLLAREEADERAAEAVALFCYQTKKWIGAYAAALGGIDTLVFSGGIGENAAPVRSRVCAGLGFLGITIDEERNTAHAGVISTDASRTTVRIIPTDEELMIARSVRRVLAACPDTEGDET